MTSLSLFGLKSLVKYRPICAKLLENEMELRSDTFN